MYFIHYIYICVCVLVCNVWCVCVCWCDYFLFNMQSSTFLFFFNNSNFLYDLSLPKASYNRKIFREVAEINLRAKNIQIDEMVATISSTFTKEKRDTDFMYTYKSAVVAHIAGYVGKCLRKDDKLRHCETCIAAVCYTDKDTATEQLKDSKIDISIISALNRSKLTFPSKPLHYIVT